MIDFFDCVWNGVRDLFTETSELHHVISLCCDVVRHPSRVRAVR